MKKLITCDIICMGTPSPVAFSEYLIWLGNRCRSRITGYEHRGKWIPWGIYQERAMLDDGRIVCKTTDSMVWRRIWNRLLLRPSCYECRYHSTKRPGDLTIGDFWGLDGFQKELGDNLGVSCVLVNDSSGLDVLRELHDYIQLKACTLENVANQKQPMLCMPPEKPKTRHDFWSTVISHGFEAGVKSTGILSLSRRMKDVVNLFIPFGRCENEQEVNTSWRDEDNLDSLSGNLSSFPLAFAARNRSSDIRRKSSSGGMFYALASWAIARGGIVYGCAFDENLRAHHVRCETLSECERCMGSKYSQSDMGDVISLIKNDLEDGRLVLFTGTPCQVAAVRSSCRSTLEAGK